MTDMPTPAAPAATNALALSDPDNLIAQLDPQYVEQARQNAANLRQDESQILGLGVQAQRDLAQLSTRFTDQMRVKDTSIVGESLTDLLDQVNALNPNSLKSYTQLAITRLPLLGPLFGWFDQVVRFKRKYDTINTRVGQIAEELRKGCNEMQEGMTSMKAQAQDCRRYRVGLLMAFATAYYKKRDLESERTRLQGLEQTDSVREQIRSTTMFIRAFDRKIEDLMLHQLAALQVAYEMDDISESDFGLLSQLQTATQTTIPLWRFNAGAAMGLTQQRNARQLIDAVRETNTRIITGMSDLYRQEATATAQALEKPSIDPEALNRANDSLKSTTLAIQEIYRQGEDRRRKSLPQVVQWTQSLQVTMTSFE